MYASVCAIEVFGIAAAASVRLNNAVPQPRLNVTDLLLEIATCCPRANLRLADYPWIIGGHHRWLHASCNAFRLQGVFDLLDSQM